MEKIMVIFLLIVNIASLCRCDKIAMDKKYSIIVMNNASHSISCYFALGGYYGTVYPDTSLPASNQYIINDIKAGSRYYYDSGIEWEEIYSRLPKDTMSVFFFHSDTLKAYSWEKIRNDYNILKRYDLSLDDLNRMNWIITYP